MNFVKRQRQVVRIVRNNMSCKKCRCGKGTCGTIERRIGSNDFNPEIVLNTGDTYNGIKCIAIEDLITLVCTEFVKQNKKLIQWESCDKYGNYLEFAYVPYLKMNYKARRKLSEKLLDKMEKDIKNG